MYFSWTMFQYWEKNEENWMGIFCITGFHFVMCSVCWIFFIIFVVQPTNKQKKKHTEVKYIFPIWMELCLWKDAIHNIKIEVGDIFLMIY